ncbi:uncharacterized protein [Setaria viridis]|uniref:uncharacterized protein n=1 Tax=Setaria viridis TaxID=4556 RepID=UPI001493BBBD|nr:uncharacterized protein LOC117853541 [Setaria viridis]
MAKDEEQRRDSFRKRHPNLFAMVHDLFEEFNAHAATVAFFPVGSEPQAFGGPTMESVLRTYLPADGPLRQPSSIAASHGAAGGGGGAEMAGEVAARVAGMRRELVETKALVATEWERVADAAGKIREAQATAQKENWWEVNVEALGEEELQVCVEALEILKADVQERVDAMASARMSLPRC